MKKMLCLAALSLIIFFISRGSAMGVAMDKIYTSTRIILKGFAPKKEVVSHLLNKEFFIEEREETVVKKIKENLFYVYDKKTKEKEFCLENDDNSKQFGLFHKKNNLKVDRRTQIQNIFDIPYRPISLLRGIYKLNNDNNGKLIYHGSGFRNSLNQIVTAGHNLYLSSSDIEFFCDKEKISLKKYDFDIDLLSIELIFGISSKEGKLYYTNVSTANGRNCFVDKNRDFGIINLPMHQKAELDDTIGSLPLALIPDQPHEYMGKNITIVGYPGEKNPKSLWHHSGPIKYMDADKVITYDVDTTRGNSGSPGFMNFIPEGESKDINDFPVCLIHTNSNNPFNSGQGFDNYILDIIEKNNKN